MDFSLCLCFIVCGWLFDCLLVCLFACLLVCLFLLVYYSLVFSSFCVHIFLKRMCMNTLKQAYTYMRIHHTHTHACTHARVGARMCTHTHTCTLTHTHTQICAHVHTCTHTQAHSHSSPPTPWVFAAPSLPTHPPTRFFPLPPSPPSPPKKRK